MNAPRSASSADLAMEIANLARRQPPHRRGRAGPRALDDAREGSEGAFAQLVEPHRSELYSHCYRMVGSVHDAEDALQEVLVDAWRGLPKFEGRSSLRSWLYRIATNNSLDMIAKRSERILPIDRRPANPDVRAGEPLGGAPRLEPNPAETLAIEDGCGAPEARCEQREAIELAFTSALQLLPAKQRAVLILRGVLGFSAQETANALETTVASVTSALQRARGTIDKRHPERSRQKTARALRDERLRKVVERYVDAWERNDVEAVVSMLAQDARASTASSTMPPRDQG
jgi:RNA polymerase sigma-70 factor, ECF subfamily